MSSFDDTIGSKFLKRMKAEFNRLSKKRKIAMLIGLLIIAVLIGIGLSDEGIKAPTIPELESYFASYASAFDFYHDLEIKSFDRNASTCLLTGKAEMFGTYLDVEGEIMIPCYYDSAQSVWRATEGTDTRHLNFDKLLGEYDLETYKILTSKGTLLIYDYDDDGIYYKITLSTPNGIGIEYSEREYSGYGKFILNSVAMAKVPMVLPYFESRWELDNEAELIINLNSLDFYSSDSWYDIEISKSVEIMEWVTY